MGAGGPERNTAATPFAYTVGQACTQARGALATSTATTLETNLRVAPNPSSDRATVSFDLPQAESTYALDLYDLTGRLARPATTGIGSGRQTLELRTSNLAAGVYVLRLVTGQQTYTQRLVVTH